MGAHLQQMRRALLQQGERTARAKMLNFLHINRNNA
jgi:hypothetical protein